MPPTREPIATESSGVAYHPDTFQGRVDYLAKKAKEARDFYLRGDKPLVPTASQGEK